MAIPEISANPIADVDRFPKDILWALHIKAPIKCQIDLQDHHFQDGTRVRTENRLKKKTFNLVPLGLIPIQLVPFWTHPTKTFSSALDLYRAINLYTHTQT